VKSLPIILGSIALVTCPFARAQGDDGASEVPKAQLASMGLAGLRSMSDAEGNQVRGHWAALGGSGYIGIPRNSAGGSRFVVRLNGSYYEGVPNLGAVILSQLLEVRNDAEPIPPGRREF